MEDINIKDMDIICYSDNRMLNIFNYKRIYKLSDIVKCTKLVSRQSVTTDTEEIYQGFRRLALYRYCGITIDNSKLLNSTILFDSNGFYIQVDGENISLYKVLHRLGLNYWEESTIRYLIKEGNYINREPVNLDMIFNDILNNKLIIDKSSRKIVLIMLKKIALILEANVKAINEQKNENQLDNVSQK